MPFFGIRPSGWLNADPASQAAAIIQWAVHAEELGFDVLFVGDRLLAKAKSADDTKVYEGTMLDPFVLLSSIAARTQRIRLATLVAIVPFRHPASFAKLTASLDVVSNGRFVLGAGSGWSAPELAMFGIPREKRGAYMEEAIDVVRRLWTGESVTSEGFWKLDDVRVTPTPVQQPGPPVWLASFAPEDSFLWPGSLTPGQLKVLDRVGRIADGWAPAIFSAAQKRHIHPDQFGQGWEAIAESATRAGRNPDDIDIIYSQWVAIVRNQQERENCEATLARYFTGDYEEARKTYLVGTPEEIVDLVAAQTAKLPRVDGFVCTPLSDDPGILDVIASELRPRLEEIHA